MQPKSLVCENHRAQPIISVCLNKLCKNSRICCFLCTQDHIQHFNSLIPLNEFTSFSSSISDQDIQAFYQNNTTYNNLITLKEQITILLDLINKEIDKYSDLLLIKDLMGQGLQSKKSLDELVKLMLPFTIVKKDNQIYLDGVQEQQDITKESQSPLKKVIKQVQNCISAFVHQPIQDQVQVYAFSEVHKNPELQIDSKQPSIIKKIGDNYGVAYGELEFDLNTDNFRFAFKILQKPSNVWIGIGSIIGTKNNNYMLTNYRQIGHYQYMIAYHKFVFHHTNQKCNHVKQGFDFGLNDIINISYDAKCHKLNFKKHKSDQSYQMQIEEYDQLVRPVVWMLNKDSVQILEYQEEN